MKKFFIFAAVLALTLFLTVSFVAGFVVGDIYGEKVTPEKSSEPTATTGAPGDLEVLGEIISRLRLDYVEKPGKDKLLDGAVDGMLKSLDDPYTRRLKKSDYKSFQEQTSGHFGGVGIELGLRDKQLTVVAPIKNTPAERAGVEAGDKITKIDDQKTDGMPLEKAVKLIRGPAGTKITLTFVRNGGEPTPKTLTREEIKLPNVSGKVLDNDLAYIKLHAFNGSTAKDVRGELEELKKKKNIKGVIIDLRNNPGGLLNEAIDMSSIFIGRGPIVKVKSRNNRTETFTATSNADEKIPLVVLVNKGSASASEIFAGAVQDTSRGVVVGERTFGKASVQTVIPLSDGSGLVMTTAKYFTPKGRSLNKHGVGPDVVIKLPKEDFHKMSQDDDPQLIKAREIIRDIIAGKILKKAG